MKSTFYLQIQAVNSNLVGYLVLTLCINQISLRNQFAGGPLLGQAGRFAKASLLEPSYQAKVQTILFPSIRQAYNHRMHIEQPIVKQQGKAEQLMSQMGHGSRPKRTYNPIMAMVFLAMFTFQLDNTKQVVINTLCESPQI